MELQEIEWKKFRRKHPIVLAVKVPFDCRLSTIDGEQSIKCGQYLIRMDDNYSLCDSDLFEQLHEEIPFELPKLEKLGENINET